MPTVEFSPAYLGAMTYTDLTGGFGAGIFWTGTASTPYQSCLGSTNSRLALHSGTIPAQPRLMTPSDFANTLIFWRLGAGQDFTTFTRGSSATVTLTTSFLAAIATGTVTWFSWTYYTATPPSTGGTLYQRIIGTVGTVGSGADLEIPSTSIVTGNPYRVYNFRLTLPSTYTY